jgi:hypothetical protein
MSDSDDEYRQQSCCVFFLLFGAVLRRGGGMAVIKEYLVQADDFRRNWKHVGAVIPPPSALVGRGVVGMALIMQTSQAAWLAVTFKLSMLSFCVVCCAGLQHFLREV